MNLESVNLNLLVPLDVLLRTRNVTQAGRELRLSQSATSEVLSKLRRTLRDPLLVRSGRSLVLTPYAEALQEQLREALRLIDQLMTERPHFDPSARREFTIVASDYVTLVVQPSLADLADVAPGISISWQPLADDFSERIRRDNAEFISVSTGVRKDRLDPALPSAPLFHDRFVLCGWSGNAALREPLTADKFSELPYVQYRTGRRPSLADQTLEELHVRTRVQVQIQSPNLAPFLLPGGPLVTLVPLRLARVAAAAVDIVFVDPPFPLPAIEQLMVWHPRRTLDPAHTWLRERLSAMAAETGCPDHPLGSA